LAQKRILIFTVAAMIVVGLFPTGATAQQPPDAEMVASIRGEELHHSSASELFYTLTDSLGPRLSGSSAYDKAARWVLDRLREWGLANPHLESFKFGPAWTLEKLTTEMTAPRYMPLLAYAEAWSPSTAGVVTGTPVYVGDSSVEEIDALGGRLRHAIVLTARPQTEYLSKDREEPSQGDGPVRTGNPLFPSPSSRVPQRELLARLQKYGAGVALAPSATLHGTVRVQGNRNSSRRRAHVDGCRRTIQHAGPLGESRGPVGTAH